MRFDIRALIQDLEADRHNAPPDLSWIEASTRDPGPFWAALADHHASLRAPRPWSRPGERFDLYHDMVVRHLAPERPALRWHERASGWSALSFAELHARVSRKAGEWVAQEVAPGDVLAIVLPPGPAYLVALLAALRLGLCVSVLPPLGDRWLRRRLAKLGPRHVVTEPEYRSLLGGDFEALVLRDRLPTHPYPERWHTYAPGEIVGLFFSPLREPLDAPAKLTADMAYLGAVRDGLFSYLLGPGDALAAPGFHPLQCQPALLFATLLAGATFLEAPLAEVIADPAILTKQSLRAVGIHRALRDALALAPRGAPQGWDAWFKDPAEPFDVEAWRRFVEAQGIEGTPHLNLLIDAAAGGCSLISARRRGGNDGVGPAKRFGGPDWRVAPAPGVPFTLEDVNGSGDEAAAAYGLFVPEPPGKGYVVLAKSGPEYACAGTVTPRRDGRVYPRDEVVDAVKDLPFVAGASVVALPSGSASAGPTFALVVFTGAEATEAAAAATPARERAIARAITAHVGAEFVPDRVSFYPLYPRMKGEALDADRVEADYRTGMLARKARRPMFAALTALRKRCVLDLEEA
ncbi:AMP-binding protein [Sorangium sp. So ce1099]|uniref:AMP-binding protein n=1 Tax=Sorangium sp. So ce1099 TaxID=3133331 RepID=UPI003F63E481